MRGAKQSRDTSHIERTHLLTPAKFADSRCPQFPSRSRRTLHGAVWGLRRQVRRCAGKEAGGGGGSRTGNRTGDNS